MMEYKFSNHSMDKISKRNIPVELIDEVLKFPEQQYNENGVEIYQGLVEIENNEYLLRIFVNEEETPCNIITVYFTSKIDKYKAKL
ncbi:MAG: hypothetical protein HW421_502 [Ignavibacteria bacterium]|nr:hypothetical protein [Ignavibacteria bacterium]